MPPAPRSITALIFGGVSLFALFSYFFFIRRGSLLKPLALVPESRKKKDNDEKDADDDTTSLEKSTTDVISKPPSVKSNNVNVIVEDDEEDDSDDEEEEAESEEALAVKAAFEDASRIALKLFNGQKYIKAAEKYTEAINLAAKVPSAASQVLTLYNNRSAVYEKNGDLDLALGDILVVLAMDPTHAKARIRRARIYELKGKSKEALAEYTFCQTMERYASNNQAPPPPYASRIDELMQKLAAEDGAAVMAAIKSKRGGLPGKAYCRNFLECFPSVHFWREQFATVNRSLLEEQLQQVGGELLPLTSTSSAATVDTDSFGKQLKAVYELVWWDLSKGTADSWTEALNRVHVAVDLLEVLEQSRGNVHASEDGSASSSSSQWPVLFSRFLQLRAVEMMLVADTEGAEKLLDRAMALCPVPSDWNSTATVGQEAEAEASRCSWETVLLICTLIVETKGSPDKVSTLLRTVLGDESGSDSDSDSSSDVTDVSVRLRKAWAYVHFASFKTRKDERGWYLQGASTNAMKYIQKALAITESPCTPQLVAVRLIALQKAVSVTLTVSIMEKAQLGFSAPPSPEDVESSKVWLKDAMALAQQQYQTSSFSASLCTVLQLEAELLLSSGDNEAAILLCDRAVSLADPDDSVPLVNKGNIMLQKSQMAQESGSLVTRESMEKGMQDVKNVFEEALRVEPNGLEALAQLGQLHSILGDLEGSMALLDRALPFARSREEAIELSQMRLATLMQLEAINELKKLQGREAEEEVVALVL
eukprot:gene389-705_t